MSKEDLTIYVVINAYYSINFSFCQKNSKDVLDTVSKTHDAIQ